MTEARSRKVFINLPVLDLPTSKKFYEALGFRFNPMFEDETAACMILSEEAYVMLLTKAKFELFTKKPTADATQQAGALYALACENREEVDALVKKAVAAGGSHALEPQDHGFMYQWSFYDPSGHHWEVFYMDEAAFASQQQQQ